MLEYSWVCFSRRAQLHRASYLDINVRMWQWLKLLTSDWTCTCIHAKSYVLWTRITDRDFWQVTSIISSDRTPHKNKRITAQTEIKIRPWAPDGAGHQEVTHGPSVVTWLTVFRKVTLTFWCTVAHLPNASKFWYILYVPMACNNCSCKKSTYIFRLMVIIIKVTEYVCVCVLMIWSKNRGT
jgi:hypothetical protein